MHTVLPKRLLAGSQRDRPAIEFLGTSIESAAASAVVIGVWLPSAATRSRQAWSHSGFTARSSMMDVDFWRAGAQLAER